VYGGSRDERCEFYVTQIVVHDVLYYPVHLVLGQFASEYLLAYVADRLGLPSRLHPDLGAGTQLHRNRQIVEHTDLTLLHHGVGHVDDAHAGDPTPFLGEHRTVAHVDGQPLRIQFVHEHDRSTRIDIYDPDSELIPQLSHFVPHFDMAFFNSPWVLAYS